MRPGGGNELLERTTGCSHEGVAVDSMGDGLFAIWNAPADQPDHAARACRAPLDMRVELEGRFAEACRRIHPLLAASETQDDVPTLTLIVRAVECLKNPPADFDPAIRVGKG